MIEYPNWGLQHFIQFMEENCNDGSGMYEIHDDVWDEFKLGMLKEAGLEEPHES